ncbi:MAG: ABC-F family ATP-binding cassette domain-containing protein [Clostridia bacterium]
MLKIENLSFSFPEKELFDDISFTIEDGQKCAFIGASGSGKSTLASMILDPDKLMFDGKLEIDGTTGHISQFYHLDKDDKTTVFDYISANFVEIEKKTTEICEKMADTDDLESLLEEYQVLLDEFASIDGDNYENNILKKLGLANMIALKDVEISKISGGEFKLVQVIKEMLINPNFIVMDEPDAFLDFENINSLKNLINTHKGTLFVITHSRFLLNHCFNKIVHLENMKLMEFDGNFVNYNFELLRDKVELQELAFNDDEEIRRNDEMIERLRELATKVADPSKGRSLKARVKIQERLEARRIKGPFISIKQPDLVLKTDLENVCDVVLKVENLNISFDDMLLCDVNFEINKNEKIALIGANGTGKTTLLREIYKNIQASESVKKAYLSQQPNEMLTDSNTVFDEFFEAGFKSYDQIREYLLPYGFEQMEQKIAEFSGGEKNVLQLAKIASSNANFLLLDEPTSHLDTYAQLALEKAINDFNGTVLMVSHDFYTIINCVDYVIILENKTARKISMRKFRKMIYANYFDLSYLEIEQEKKQVEILIEQALHKNDFEKAKILMEDLEKIIEKM